MPYVRTEESYIDGYEGLGNIQASTLRVIRHDLVSDPAYVRTLMNELALSNPVLAMALLANARAFSSDDKGQEAAYLKGAMTIVAVLVRRDRTRKLAASLNNEQSSAERAPTYCMSCISCS